MTLASCIKMLEKMGQGDTCSDLRIIVGSIEEVLGFNDPAVGIEQAMEAAGIAT